MSGAAATRRFLNEGTWLHPKSPGILASSPPWVLWQVAATEGRAPERVEEIAGAARMQLEPRGRTHDGSLGHSSRRLAGLGFVCNLHGHGRAHAALAGVVSAVQAPLAMPRLSLRGSTSLGWSKELTRTGRFECLQYNARRHAVPEAFAGRITPRRLFGGSVDQHANGTQYPAPCRPKP
jgi:hypothetical protein